MSTPEAPGLAIEVEVIDETGAAGDVGARLRQVAHRTLETEGLVGSYVLGITFVDAERIRELNRQHRGVDQVTDVLSFPLTGEDAAEFVLPVGAPIHLGDIVVCLEQMRRQASELGHSFERETAYLTAHGVLHLLGHDHEVEAERRQMRAREEEILADLPR